jgi:Fumarylacetoacetate (FAA) hydrolase family
VFYLVSYRSRLTAPFWRAGVVRERVLVDLSQRTDQNISKLYEDGGLSVRSFLIYSVAKIIAFLSSFMTLEPGDLIATGTPSGVGGMRHPPLFLRDGDLVEGEREGIGVIGNPVIASTLIESNER